MITYLALGDSYTIGEQVPLADSFPYQTVQFLRRSGVEITAPEVIAKTGWTTGELLNAIDGSVFLKRYDFVSLLIGVNNQYRGIDLQEYKIEFKTLLNKAIEFAGNNSKNVFVLSIPDWGITPFAEGRDQSKIAIEIDDYNEACKIITEKSGCIYIDITASQRKDNTSVMLAADGLHPSGKEYRKWAEKLAAAVSGLHSA